MSEARRELLAIIARLEVMSHVPALNQSPKAEVGGATTGDEKNPGGSRPRGGIDRKDDREPDFALKSADHYRRRLAGAQGEHTVTLILADAQKTLDAWMRTPVTGDPEWGSFAWRKQIVRDIETGKRTIDGCRAHYGVSRATVYRYLEQYGQDKAA